MRMRKAHILSAAIVSCCFLLVWHLIWTHQYGYGVHQELPQVSKTASGIGTTVATTPYMNNGKSDRKNSNNDTTVVSFSTPGTSDRKLNRKKPPHCSNDTIVVNCLKLLEGDPCHIWQGEMSSEDPPNDYKTDAQFASMSCSELTRGYWTGPVSRTELDYPIAFTVLAYKDFYQVNKLMQAIHRKHNAYCIHVDEKSPKKFYAAVRRLAGCLGNIDVAESRVEWSQRSVLLADLKCFRSLLYGNRTWNYIINLTGQEYPIRTHKEMIRIIKQMNGANDVQRAENEFKPYPQMQNDTGLSNITWYKGSTHVILSRQAVEYIFEDPRAQMILDHILKHYTHGLIIPDETLYPTLNFNYALLKFPGSLVGNTYPSDAVFRHSFRHKIWSYECKAGLSVHGICILGNADLKDLDKRHELFANKFYYNFQRDAFRCVQERFWNNTWTDYQPEHKKTHTVPLSFYANLDILRKLKQGH